MVRLPHLVVAVALLTAGCATERTLQQLYVPLGTGAGFGYSEQPVAGQRYVVTYDAPIRTAFTFNGAEGRREADAELARAYDLALMRAADIALANGAPAFRVSNRTNDVDVRNHPTYRGPFWYSGWRRPWGYPYGGWPYYYGAYPDDSYATLTARVTLTVDLLPALEPGAFDAARTQAEIRNRYTAPQA